MLLELHIAGLGVIEDVSLELSPGLNVVTGETGAGKTLVTVGIQLALGHRAQAHLVRDGADRALVEARFQAGEGSPQEWAEDGELVVSRTIAADGRSSARAGGQMAPLSTLARLGEELVEVHGQHRSQRLLSPSEQLMFLDRFAGPDHLVRLDAYRDAYRRLREARRRLGELDERAREREREKDLLAYQVAEIEAAGLSEGEVEANEAEASRLEHAERILERAREARSGVDGGSEALAVAAAALAEAAALDRAGAALAERVRSLAEEARDAAAELRAYAEGIELDPERLDLLRERLAAIRGLERKYGEGEAGVLAYLADARARLAALERAGEEREELGAEVARLTEELETRGRAVTEARREAAPRLGAAIERELLELGMEGARTDVVLLPLGEPGPDGLESAELRFAGGPGQEPRPLSKVASGGELSRTMLACRTVLADLDDVPTLVFDEVDAGIGGRAGVAVGRRLARLARTRQVLVVTHLPQIACFADRHVRVTKESGTAGLELLSEDQRIDELARMLSGLPTAEAATHARQLLEEASKERETAH